MEDVTLNHKTIMAKLSSPFRASPEKVMAIAAGLAYMGLLVENSEHQPKVQPILDALYTKMCAIVAVTDLTRVNGKVKRICREAMTKIIAVVVRLDFLGESTTRQQTKIYDVANAIYNLCRE